MSQAFIIQHPEFGIFIGVGLGLAFWSEIDSVGQPAAVAFESEQAAKELLARLPAEDSLWCEIKPITIAEPGYATVTEIIAAGYKGWFNENTPTAGPIQ